MTMTRSPAAASVSQPSDAHRPRWERAGLGVLLVVTAVLYTWDLAASGWANSFYAAAVQAGSQSWKALLFGSSDAANAITVDKTPASLWVMGVSARVFGFNSWSVLVPQAVEGLLAVAVLFASVRRAAGPAAGLLAGAVLAFTPAAALIFRFDNPDALLVLSLVVAAYCTLRAIERSAGAWWLPLAGAAIGVGFLAKMMQAFLVVPVFALVYLVAAHGPVRRRVLQLLAGGAGLAVSAGWYLLLVAMWPADDRPYIGGSQHDSIIELALGYNGVGRITGNETGGLGNLNQDVGWGRLFGAEMGPSIGWLLPAAIISGAAGLWITRRAPRTDRTRAALLLWGGWLLVTAVTFSFMNGIVHPYYTVALAPAVAALVGIGAVLLWRRRADLHAATAIAGTVLVTTVLGCVLLGRDAGWHPWLRVLIAVAGVGAAALVLMTVRLPKWSARCAAGLALLACLAGPSAYAVATAATPHTGAIPSVGPSNPSGPRGGGGGPMGGLLGNSTVDSQLAATIATDAESYTWAAATVGSNNAATYQLSSGAPVMAVGGFNGTDPAPTLEQFQADVRGRAIHCFIGGEMRAGGRAASSGSDDAERIAQWVAANFTAATVGGVTVYDLTEHAAS